MRRRLVLLGVLLVAAWAIVAGIWLVRAYSDLSAGRDAANRARDHLGPQDVADRAPLADLRTAANRFSSAHDLAGSLVLAPLRVLPVVGRQLRSVDALSGAAARVSAAGVDGVDTASAVFDHPAAAGTARVDQVRQLRDIVERVASAVLAVDDLGPRKGLVGPLATARNDFAEDLDSVKRTLTNARAGSDAALSLVTGPRRYLVLAANNAEMRSGSGMWLQGGVLDARDGNLDLGDMVSLPIDAVPPKGAVVPTGDLAARWGFLEPGNEWRSLMASPRFEESAKLAVQMWKAAGRGDVDGVLAVDAIGLQAIISAAGPAVVEDRTVTAPDVPAYVLHDQYLQFADLSPLGLDNSLRQEAIGGLARSAVAAMNRGDYRPSTLVRTLGEAIAGRHLLGWTTDETESAGWHAAGMDGELSADSLLVSLLNIGSNKLDWFTDVAASLHVTEGSDGWDVAVELDITNKTPEGEPKYVTGPLETGYAVGSYHGILAVNLPAGARRGRFEGIETLNVAGADGPTRVVGMVLGLERGEARTVVLRFSLPRSADFVVVEPSARVPGVRWRYGSRSWQDTSPRSANLQG